MSEGGSGPRWKDRARLQRIESQLTEDDPGFAEVFRSWRPSGAGSSASLPSSDETVPLWAIITFLVAFTGWVLGPMTSVLLGLVGFWWARRTGRDPFAAARRRERLRRRTGT
jgi:hypothetical protein